MTFPQHTCSDEMSRQIFIPRLNHVSSPRTFKEFRVWYDSLANPHPLLVSIDPPNVYMTVSKSGDTFNPWKTSSSPTLTTQVRSAGSNTEANPRIILAPPTPPAKATMLLFLNRLLNGSWALPRVSKTKVLVFNQFVIGSKHFLHIFAYLIKSCRAQACT